MPRAHTAADYGEHASRIGNEAPQLYPETLGQDDALQQSQPPRMAIAPSKLGQVIAACMYSGGDAMVDRLRRDGLVRADARHEDLVAALDRALREHEGIEDAYERSFNSPNERVRVFLEPYLNEKGRRWAVPLESLELPDEESEPKEAPWWRAWWHRVVR